MSFVALLASVAAVFQVEVLACKTATAPVADDASVAAVFYVDVEV